MAVAAHVTSNVLYSHSRPCCCCSSHHHLISEPKRLRGGRLHRTETTTRTIATSAAVLYPNTGRRRRRSGAFVIAWAAAHEDFHEDCHEDDAKDDGDEYVGWNGGGLVHSGANVHPSVIVSPGAVVLARAEVSQGCQIGSNSVVGNDVKVGENTRVNFNVSLENCAVGKKCVIHSGVCIGADGFGFYINDETGEMVKKPQELGVVVGDEVEIGANTCIDRGSWRDTEIGSFTKLDNLCQVGHNAVVGEKCILCAHVALGGSCTLGDYIIMGGKAAVRDHVQVCSYVRIAAKAGVIKDIEARGDYAGFPAQASRDWKEQKVVLKKLTKKYTKWRIRD